MATASRRKQTRPNGQRSTERSRCALLLIDVINDLEFDGGEKLLPRALPMARKLATFVKRARASHVPVVYVNDNFGRWRSDFRAQVRHCLDDGVRGQVVVELLRPADDDYFVLKPKHSAFFSTALDTLLESLGADTLILTGLAGDNCVLFTAHDAYMRDFRLWVPSDCIASESAVSNAWALRHMTRFLKVDTRIASRIDLQALKRRSGGGDGARDSGGRARLRRNVTREA